MLKMALYDDCCGKRLQIARSHGFVDRACISVGLSSVGLSLDAPNSKQYCENASHRAPVPEAKRLSGRHSETQTPYAGETWGLQVSHNPNRFLPRLTVVA